MSLLKRALFAQSSAVEEDVVVDEEGDEYYDALEVSVLLMERDVHLQCFYFVMQIMNFCVDDDDLQAQLHPDACADGGIRCTDTQVMDRQKK